MEIYTIFRLFKCLIENIVQSNQSYIFPNLFLTWTSQQHHKGNRQKNNVKFLRCSEAFRVEFDYYYEMICIFHLCQLHILGVRGCQEKQEAISWVVFRLAWTKSKDRIAFSEGLDGVNRCGRKMGQKLSPLGVKKKGKF